MSKVNCKHQKSIVNSKIQAQFWEKKLFLFISVVVRQAKEEKSEVLIIGVTQLSEMEHFHQKAMFKKVH